MMGGGENAQRPCIPVSISQLRRDFKNESIYTLDKPQFVILGTIRQVTIQPTDVVMYVDDGSGVLKVTWYSPTPWDSMENGSYVKCYGQFNNSDGGEGWLTAYSCRPLTTFNEVTHHLTKVAYCFKELGGGMSGGVQGNSGGAQQTSSNQMSNQVQEDSTIPLFAEIQNALTKADSDSGCSIGDIINAIGQDHREQILQSINMLGDEGIIYTTTDDDHYAWAGAD